VAEAIKSNVRTMVTVIFGVFFLLNVLLLVMAIWAAFGGGGKATLIPDDLGMGVRMMIFLVGAGISWFLGRWLFLQMVEGEVGVEESSNASFVLLFYLLLIFVGLAFLGAWTWLWQAILLLVLVLLTLFVLRRVVGLMAAVLIMALCVAAGAAVYFLFK
jgi:hypothetical protein